MQPLLASDLAGMNALGSMLHGHFRQTTMAQVGTIMTVHNEIFREGGFHLPKLAYALLPLTERSFVNCIAACRSAPESGDKLPDAGDKVRQLTNCR
jgi:hypothetical protein